MKWFAIKGPDGEIVGVGPAPIRAWQAARDSVDGDLSVYRTWYRHDRYDDSVAACKSIGYRCVEVDLAEPGTTGALKRAREAWDILVTCRASVNAPPEHRALMEVAMQTLGEVLGRVTDNAASDGGDKEAGE